MFSLITNATCFTMKFVSHQAVHCVNHDRNLFILSVIKTTLRDSFHLSQTKHFSANVVSLLKAAMPFVPEGLDK